MQYMLITCHAHFYHYHYLGTLYMTVGMEGDIFDHVKYELQKWKQR